MIRRLFAIMSATLLASVAFANTHPPSVGQNAPALHLMNSDEFTTFLGRLDSEMLDSKVQLKNVDVKSLGLDLQTGKELQKCQVRSMQSLDNVREDIEYLSQRQTLKFDFLLLIDLNELARNLDALDQGLMNSGVARGSATERKSLDYARQVLAIEAGVSPRITAFQHHILAFTGVIDATLDQAADDSVEPRAEK